MGRREASPFSIAPVACASGNASVHAEDNGRSPAAGTAYAARGSRHHPFGRKAVFQRPVRKARGRPACVGPAPPYIRSDLLPIRTGLFILATCLSAILDTLRGSPPLNTRTAAAAGAGRIAFAAVMPDKKLNRPQTLFPASRRQLARTTRTGGDRRFQRPLTGKRGTPIPASPCEMGSYGRARCDRRPACQRASASARWAILTSEKNSSRYSSLKGACLSSAITSG